MIRTGFGYDSHRLVTGRKLILGGVDIAWPMGLLGHSDADVLAHAIGDALLGAIGKGDLGTHFPDDDPAYKDISSLMLLEHIANLVRADGYRINNIDATVVLEEPKLRPHIEQMRGNIAKSLGYDTAAVNIKATTNEKMGYAGRGEGIGAFAVATVRTQDAL